MKVRRIPLGLLHNKAFKWDCGRAAVSVLIVKRSVYGGSLKLSGGAATP